MTAIKILIFLFFLMLFTGVSPAAVTSGEEIQNKTLFAWYIVGSDLESVYGAATLDIAEMIKGYGDGISPDIDIIIGYGGSTKEGWNGLTISTIDDINADYHDGIIGNEAWYRYRDVDQNMGDQKALETFLKQATGMGNYTRCHLFFWDHGASYYGIGFDENNYLDRLTIRELKNALSESDLPIDLISMDACLMGGLEVAYALSNSGGYLLASEETVSGYGFNYSTIFDRVRKEPDISGKNLGKQIIDAYITQSKTGEGKKTLSLIDLSRVHLVTEALSSFSERINTHHSMDSATFKEIGGPLFHAQRFGYLPEGDLEIAVDLADFAGAITLDNPETRKEKEKLLRAIQSCIIYSREDGSRPGSTGLSVFSPRNKNKQDLSSVTRMISLNRSWDMFLENYIIYVNEDMIKPVITMTPGGRYNATDNIGVARVMVTLSHVPADGDYSYFYLISSEPVYPDLDGNYLPCPSMEVLYLSDFLTGEKALLKTSFSRYDPDGLEQYVSTITVTRDGTSTDLIMEIASDPATGMYQYQLTPYRVDQKTGGYLFYRVPFTFELDDIITTKISKAVFSDKNDPLSTTLDTVPYETITVSGPVKVIPGPLPEGTYFCTLQAFDYAMNGASINLGKLRPPNRSVIVHEPEE